MHSNAYFGRHGMQKSIKRAVEKQYASTLSNGSEIMPSSFIWLFISEWKV